MSLVKEILDFIIFIMDRVCAWLIGIDGFFILLFYVYGDPMDAQQWRGLAVLLGGIAAFFMVLTLIAAPFAAIQERAEARSQDRYEERERWLREHWHEFDQAERDWYIRERSGVTVYRENGPPVAAWRANDFGPFDQPRR